MQRNPHRYQIATGYRTFYSLSLIYQPITKKRLFFTEKDIIHYLNIRFTLTLNSSGLKGFKIKSSAPSSNKRILFELLSTLDRIKTGIWLNISFAFK